MSGRCDSETRASGMFVPPADVELFRLGGWEPAVIDGAHQYVGERVLMVPPAEDREGEAA